MGNKGYFYIFFVPATQSIIKRCLFLFSSNRFKDFTRNREDKKQKNKIIIHNRGRKETAKHHCHFLLRVTSYSPLFFQCHSVIHCLHHTSHRFVHGCFSDLPKVSFVTMAFEGSGFTIISTFVTSYLPVFAVSLPARVCN